MLQAETTYSTITAPIGITAAQAAEIAHRERLPNGLHPRAEPAVVRITGDAMAPTYSDGSYLLIDAAVRRPSPAGVFVLRAEETYTAMRCQVVLCSDPLMVRLLPDNHDHERDIVPADALDVAGVVICALSEPYDFIDPG